MAHLGNRVKALRMKEDMTQEELGDKLNIGRAAVSLIESKGTTSNETMEALAKFFKVDKKWLATGEGVEPKGLIIQMNKGVIETPWKDEAYKALQNENQRLWRLIEKITGAPAGSIANFSKVVRFAGKQRSLHLTTEAA